MHSVLVQWLSYRSTFLLDRNTDLLQFFRPESNLRHLLIDLQPSVRRFGRVFLHPLVSEEYLQDLRAPAV